MAPTLQPNPKAFMLQVLLLTKTMCSARIENAIIERKRHRTFIRSRRNNLSPLQPKIKSILAVRGGQSSYDPYANFADYSDQPNYNNDPKDGFDNYSPPADFTNAEHLFKESVQDRVDRWRQAQVEQQSTITPIQELNPRDEQGRMKLMSSVGRGSLALIFFVIMWRDIHLFELADQSFKGFARTITVVPLIFMFIGNMAGVVASFTSPSHTLRKRMKAILNLDKLVEGVLLIWYFFRLTVAPSKFVPREVYVAKTLHCVLFLVQLQAFTRFTWWVVLS